VTGLWFRFDSKQQAAIVQALFVGFSIIRQAALLGIMVWYVLPNTIFSDCLRKMVKIILPNFPDSHANIEAIFAYFLGYGLTLFFLIMYVYVRFTRWVRSAPAIHLTDKILIFNGLYLLDFFISTTERFPFALSLWVFATFMSFYFCALWCLKEQAIRLTQLLILLIAQQCVYAVVYHTLGLRQFHSPGFGPRAVGTFDNPSHLYPLCLVGIPISLILAEMEITRGWRWFWRGITTMMLLVLVLTYTRAGWVACGVSLGYLALSTYSLLSKQKNTRRVLIVLTLILLTGAIFVRTKGRVAGNPDDRSFWGRIAIWGTALKVIADHPILGNGVSTYFQKQREHMTPDLQRFNPMNTEPKNLYLHIAVEFGLTGLVIFLFLIRRYVQLYRFVIQTFPPSDDAYAVVIGIHASLLGVFIAGFFDTPILHFTRSASSVAVACLLGVLCSLVNQANSAPIFDKVEIQRRKRKFWRIAGVGLIVLLLVAVYLLRFLIDGIKLAQEALPQVQHFAEHYPKNTSFVRLKDISEDMIYAVVASEDSFFYSHRGVDWLALHRALRKNLRAMSFVQGGSTITMQVARYVFLSRERTLSRKIAEIILALKMERYLSKERILELYLNTARFGMGQDGILAAARNYFGKYPKDLTLSEAAFLAGVLPEPPFDRRKVTPEFVWRCQRRAFERLRAFFPHKYPPEVLERVQKEPLRFKWGQVITPSAGGTRK
jgi:O-antigen ligase